MCTEKVPEPEGPQLEGLGTWVNTDELSLLGLLQLPPGERCSWREVSLWPWAFPFSPQGCRCDSRSPDSLQLTMRVEAAPKGRRAETDGARVSNDFEEQRASLKWPPWTHFRGNDRPDAPLSLAAKPRRHQPAELHADLSGRIPSRLCRGSRLEAATPP